jgi:hypothetical protein
LAVPPAFVAEILKWQVVLAVRPLMAADTAAELSPEPGDGVHGAVDP